MLTVIKLMIVQNINHRNRVHQIRSTPIKNKRCRNFYAFSPCMAKTHISCSNLCTLYE
nr:MAG TPA: hypothetical protein [Caudoviricetes sp.]